MSALLFHGVLPAARTGSSEIGKTLLPGCFPQKASVFPASAPGRLLSDNSNRLFTLVPVVKATADGGGNSESKSDNNEKWWLEIIPSPSSEIGKKLMEALNGDRHGEVWRETTDWLQGYVKAGKKNLIEFPDAELISTLLEVKFICIVALCLLNGLRLLRSSNDFMKEKDYVKIQEYLSVKFGPSYIDVIAVGESDVLAVGETDLDIPLMNFYTKYFTMGMNSAVKNDETYTGSGSVTETAFLLGKRLTSFFNKGPSVFKPATMSPSPPGYVFSVTAFIGDAVLFGALTYQVEKWVHKSLNVKPSAN